MFSKCAFASEKLLSIRGFYSYLLYELADLAFPPESVVQMQTFGLQGQLHWVEIQFAVCR